MLNRPTDDARRFVRVAAPGDVPVGAARTVELGGRTIALFHTRAGWFALEDSCSHAGGPLSEGEVEDGRVTCPWHGAAFDLASGRSDAAFASIPVRCYDVRVVGDRVEIAPR